MIRVLADTGSRRAELVALDSRDVDFENLRLTIRSGKGNKQRIVPITEALGSDLRHLIGKQSPGPLFLSRLGSAMQPREVNRILERAGNLADVKHPDPNRESINPHLLRHTFANNWKKQRGDYEALQQILGHASIATTVDSYGRLSVDDIQECYRLLMKKCPVACTGCKLCEKFCEGEHIQVMDFLAEIDYQNPPTDFSVVGKCPTGALVVSGKLN